jgi:hypothetical protein
MMNKRSLKKMNMDKEVTRSPFPARSYIITKIQTR